VERNKNVKNQFCDIDHKSAVDFHAFVIMYI